MPSVPTASDPRARRTRRRAPWSWSVSPFPSPRASTVPAAETLQTARVYLEAQTNRSMKAAAAAAIAIQTCVTIDPLVRPLPAALSTSFASYSQMRRRNKVAPKAIFLPIAKKSETQRDRPRKKAAARASMRVGEAVYL